MTSWPFGRRRNDLFGEGGEGRYYFRVKGVRGSSERDSNSASGVCDRVKNM